MVDVDDGHHDDYGKDDTDKHCSNPRGTIIVLARQILLATPFDRKVDLNRHNTVLWTTTSGSRTSRSFLVIVINAVVVRGVGVAPERSGRC